MTTIRAFFLQVRALFSNFRKRARETSPPSPLVTRLGPLLFILFLYDLVEEVDNTPYVCFENVDVTL